jgi:hypothetical protein
MEFEFVVFHDLANVISYNADTKQMESPRSLWIVAIAASVAIIITIYGVWASIESQKDKFRELRFQQNTTRLLSELKSGKISLFEYCDQIPQSQDETQRICKENESLNESRL